MEAISQLSKVANNQLQYSSSSSEDESFGDSANSGQKQVHRGRGFIPFQWTRVIHQRSFDPNDFDTYEIETELLNDEERRARIGSEEQDETRLLFHPK